MSEQILIEQIFSYIGKFVAAVGGAGVIIIGCSSWISKIWAEKFLLNEKETMQKDIEKYKSKLNEQLEILKSENDKINYITKTQFDAEFKIYQELSESCFKMFYCESQLFNELDRYYVNDPINPENEIKKQQKERCINAKNAVVKFQNTLYKYAAFITEEMYERYKNFKKMNSDQVIDYENMYVNDIEDVQKEYRENGIKNCYKMAKDIEKEFEEITKELRNYLNSLKVQEG